MANLYIMVYKSTDEVAKGPCIRSEVLDIGGAGYTESAVFDSAAEQGPREHRRALIWADEAYQYERGVGADGTGTLEYMPANAPIFVYAEAGWNLAAKTIA